MSFAQGLSALLVRDLLVRLSNWAKLFLSLSLLLCGSPSSSGRSWEKSVLLGRSRLRSRSTSTSVTSTLSSMKWICFLLSFGGRPLLASRLL